MSRGLSHRLRVGFDRSGSAIGFPSLSLCCIARIDASEDFTPLATAAVRIVSLSTQRRYGWDGGMGVLKQSKGTHKVPSLAWPWKDRL